MYNKDIFKYVFLCKHRKGVALGPLERRPTPDVVMIRKNMKRHFMKMLC